MGVSANKGRAVVITCASGDICLTLCRDLDLRLDPAVIAARELKDATSPLRHELCPAAGAGEGGEHATTGLLWARVNLLVVNWLRSSVVAVCTLRPHLVCS